MKIIPSKTSHNQFAVKWAAILCLWGISLAASAAETNHADWVDLNRNGQKDVYEDASQPLEKRIADLLGQMTLDEKIGQLCQGEMTFNTDVALAGRIQNGEFGSFLPYSSVVETPFMRNKLQRIAITKSRLGVPLIFGYDVIHGFRTVFPIPLAQASAWDPGLMEQITTISAREAAAVGIDWAFAPMSDLVRDPRWGRVAESVGEDPWLASLYTAAAVHGLQGTNLSDGDHVVACLKHFVGYGATEGGRDYNTTEISEFTLRNFYLPQFKAGVDAGALTIMSAFNCLSGFPASASRHTLTEILRDQWKFPGFVVSDAASIGELINHGVAANETDAARLGLTAGVDMEMLSQTYRNTVKNQVAAGTLPESVVDEAVRRVLRVKFLKGLFDHPFVDETRYQQAFLSADALALAREAAAKSCVLLKNDAHALPLSKDVKSVALIGPLADNAEELVGCWYARAHTNELVSLAAGIRAKLSAGSKLTTARGCRIIETGKGIRHLDESPNNDIPPTGTNEITDAVATANAAEVVILALGEPRDWSGEDRSRSSLTLPGRQMELFRSVVATGKPVIVVLFGGRPLELTELQEKAAAILEAWHPGIQGGNGVADILFGDVDPTGRLVTTFLRNVGQSPFYYNHYNTGRPGAGDWAGNYIDGPKTPLYPFGFGLAYTTFEFQNTSSAPGSFALGESLTVKAKITNTGTRAGTAVAQLYIRALAASAGPRPVRELKGFQKIALQPGESQEVSFDIPAAQLGYNDSNGNWLVEPGKYQFWISSDAWSGQPVTVQLKPHP